MRLKKKHVLPLNVFQSRQTQTKQKHNTKIYSISSTGMFIVTV